MRFRSDRRDPLQRPSKQASTDPDAIQALKYQDRASITSNDHEKTKDDSGTTSASVSSTPPDSLNSVKIQVGSHSSNSKQTVPKISFFDIFRYASRRQLLLNIFGASMAIAAGASQPLMNIFIGKIATVFLHFTAAIQSGDVDAILRAQADVYRTINSDALILLYLGIGMFFASMLYMAVFSYTSERIASNIKYAYLSALFNKSIHFFEQYGQGTVAAKIGSDVHLIQIGIGEKLPMAIMYFSTFLSAGAVAFSFSWKLTLVLFPIAPMILLVGGVMGALTKKCKIVELDCIARAASRAEEAFNAIKILKAFSKERAIGQEYDTLTVDTTAAGAKAGRVQGLGVGALLFIIYSGYALAFFYGAQLIARGELLPGRIVSVVFAVFAGAFAIANLFSMIENFTMATAAASSVLGTIKQDSLAPQPATITSPDGDEKSQSPSQLRTGYHAELRLDNLSFSYPSKADRIVLNNLSLTFRSGVATAIVGLSGSGKSTIFALLQRFYEPTAGAIRIDGVDVSKLDVDWLRGQIGVVEQQPTLFAMSIHDNIELGLPDRHSRSADELQLLVVQAAKKANAHDFITALTHGYQTQVGSQGFLLSGGQKQRIAIARALIRDPKILLLDEATSALDSNSEAVVQAALEEAAKDRTTIIISHRLSTVRNAEHIIVLGQDGVIEQGSHNDLSQRPHGAFASMLRHQDVDKSSEVTASGHANLGSSAFLRPPEAQASDISHSLELARSISTRAGSMIRGASPPTPSEDAKAKATDQSNAGGLRALLHLLVKDAETGRLAAIYVVGSICAAVIGAVYPIYAILFGTAIQDYAPCNDTDGGQCPEPARGVMLHNNRISSGSFFIVAVGCAVVSFYHVRSLYIAGSRVTHRLRVLVFQSLLCLDASFFDDPTNTSNDLASSLSVLSQGIYGGVGPTLGSIIQSLATVVVGYSVAIGYGWRLALVVIASTPLTITAGLLRLRVLALKERKTKQAHNYTTQQACESIGAIRTVSAFNLQPQTLDTYQTNLAYASRSLLPTMCYSSVLFGFSQCVQLLVTALAFWYGGRELAEGRTTSKGFFTILISVVYGSIQAGNIFNYSADFSSAHSAACKSLSIIRQAQAVTAQELKYSHAAAFSNDVPSGRVALDKVTFRYPQRPDCTVLDGLSLTIEAGTFCAIVGSSGSGKSTVLQLIERFYEAEKGRVLLDGRSIAEGDSSRHRKHMSYVPQEPTLFQGTIGWNIALGATDTDPKDVPLAKIQQAAELAQLGDLLASLPEGLDTQLSARGVQMSGGQKQRIAIARAIIRDPKVLLLDEATSALDPASERAVQSALDSVSQGRTTIAVAHRLSTIAKADKVIVMQAGKVVEQGSPRELFERDGHFAHMSRLQGVSF
ncbi:multidrug resistance protein [Pseudozyma hubeiensis SY62]|uniref:Multidrug resistance protein n=1 Tax=Pseudozyma hubeiensis (strain SY62) TaxID=1305764 RepID=R9P3T9_PSEHS|nr:multidrug resistance protein [Pseudozyma hubeiensis SY62]GAC92755.1 multidrug resistance protein [Pseudozyma hubeiensis SY62]